jgi:hypothetical protein
MKKYDVALIEKPGELGLTMDDVVRLMGMLLDTEVYPIEIGNPDGNSSAMGFIGRDAANDIDFDYEASGLKSGIEEILGDMNKENELGEYKLTNAGLSVHIER